MGNMRRRPGGQAAPSIRSIAEETSPPASGVSIALYSAGNRQPQNNYLEEETERNGTVETVEFHPDPRETQPGPRQILVAPNTSTMANSSGEGPIYTKSGLQLTHRASPLRGTGTSTSTRYSTPSTGRQKSSDGDNKQMLPGGRMELLSSHHEQRQKRLLACARLGVVALCAFLAVGTKVAFSTALHEHRMMAAAAAAAGANINTNDNTGGSAIIKATTPTGTRELQTTKMGKVTSPRSLATNNNAKKRHYAEDVVRTLRSEFDAWSERHGRDYGSTEETERRYGIWLDNHHE